MRLLADMLRLALLLAMLAAAGTGVVQAEERPASGFGKVAIPDPAKPAQAENCVEPVEVMRRDHMKFLDHQRDATVIDGERGSKYSLVGCMNCHNPATESDEVIRHQDPRHFCTECHAYASVRIDCFECHADRGLLQSRQSRLQISGSSAWNSDELSLELPRQRPGVGQ